MLGCLKCELTCDKHEKKPHVCHGVMSYDQFTLQSVFIISWSQYLNWRIDASIVAVKSANPSSHATVQTPASSVSAVLLRGSDLNHDRAPHSPQMAPARPNLSCPHAKPLLSRWAREADGDKAPPTSAFALDLLILRFP